MDPFAYRCPGGAEWITPGNPFGMITWIGLCAEEVWRYLDDHEGQALLGALFLGIDAPARDHPDGCGLSCPRRLRAHEGK